MALALESMCYVDVWRQVAVPALSVTSLCGGPTSGSSSSRMPSSTRRWTSVAEYSRQGRGSGSRFAIFFRDPELLVPKSSLKCLRCFPVDCVVLLYCAVRAAFSHQQLVYRKNHGAVNILCVHPIQSWDREVGFVLKQVTQDKLGVSFLL